MPDPSAARRRRRVAALILAAACWGVGTAVSKQAVDEVPPLTLLAVQLAVSLTFLRVVMVRRRESLPTGRDGRILGRLGLLNPGLAYALSLLGLIHVTAGESVLLWALEPVLILALAVLVLHERVRPSLVGLSMIALGGLALVLYDPAASGALPGIVLTLAGVGCCAVYTVATRRWLPGSESTLGVVVAQQAYALVFALVLVAIAWLAGTRVVPNGLTAGGAIAAVVSGIVYYGLAYWLYLTGLRWIPASVAAVSFYLIPVFGIAAATAFGERLAPVQWVGAIVVIAAVGIVSVRTATEPAPDPAE